MKKFSLRGVILCVACALWTSGCAGIRQAYTVIDTQTAKRWGIEHRSRYPEIIAMLQTNTFRVMTLKSLRSKEFEIRDMNYDGTVVRCIKGFGLNDYMARWYDAQMHRSLAVSPSGCHIAYIDFDSGTLKHIDIIKSAVETVMWGMPTNMPEARFMRWWSDQELVIGIGRDEKKSDQILVINVPDRRTVLELNPTSLLLSEVGSLSWSRRYLAYVEKDTNFHERLILYDLESRCPVSEIYAERFFYGYVRWAPTDRSFLYVDGERIMEYNTSNGETKCVKEYPHDYSLLIYGYNGSEVYLRASKGGVRADDDEGWKIRKLSITSGAEEVIQGVEIRGGVWVSPDGRYVITGWGY